MSRLLKSLLVIFVLLIAAGVALYFFFPVNLAAEKLILRTLQQYGIQQASLKVESLTAEEIRLSNIKLGATLEAENARITFNPREVKEGKVQWVELEGLRLTMQRTGDTYSLGEMDALLKSPQKAGQQTPIMWPFTEIRLKNTTLTLNRDSEEPLVFTFANAAITPNTNNSALGITASSLKHVAPAPYFSPLNFNAKIITGDTISVSGKIAEEKNRFTLSARGSYNPATRNGAADIAITPLVFNEGTLAVGDIFPFLKDKIAISSGTIQGEGQIQWNEKGNRGKIILYLENAALQNALSLMIKDGMNAEGLISGRLPIVFENGDVRVENASFAAPKGGVITYRPAGSSLLDGAAQTDILKQALQNFHFSLLSLVVHNESPNVMLLKMDLSGRNPELYDGKPIELHVNLRGDFVSIIKSSLGLYTLQQDIEEKLNEKK